MLRRSGELLSSHCDGRSASDSRRGGSNGRGLLGRRESATAWPCARYRYHFRNLSAALRAPHSGRGHRERHGPPGDPRERFRLDVSGRAAGASNAHEEVAEAVVQFCDVRQHAHGRMVLTAGDGVHAVRGNVRTCMALSSVRLQRVACILAAGVLLGDALAACSRATPAEQAALMRELHPCLNIDHFEETVPPDVVRSCPRKNVEALVGVSRDDLFSVLGEPTGCRPTDRSSASWGLCRHDEVSVYYMFFPPCEARWAPSGGGGTATAILHISFSSAGVVTSPRWETPMVYVGRPACVPSPIPDDPALRAPYTAARIRMLRERLDNMLVQMRFTENHPDVIEMRKELDDLERRYSEEVKASARTGK